MALNRSALRIENVAKFPEGGASVRISYRLRPSRSRRPGILVDRRAARMSFHGGVAETILFEEWRINNAQGMIGSVIGVILLTALYEGLKSYREYLFESEEIEKVCVNTNYDFRKVFTILYYVVYYYSALLFSGVHFFQTFLHVIQIVLGYFLMFIFMTYNYWLCIAVGTGTALGYWLFQWDKANNDNTDCCS
ncbi:High affinity copper uptake protein 1 [Atta colombica]|uniref:Copper transport protein n=1 Tax=Atta colombica TaxID=520822 RepID=A0A195BQL8_9HYME|nr:High affinity copper uptake protein 1 [Atta colombica]